MPSKERYEERKRRGVCTSCGKTKEQAAKTRCLRCAIRPKERRHYRDLLFQHYGQRCVCCGEVLRLFLTFDHVKNDGNKHREEMFGSGRKNDSQAMYRWIIRNGFPSSIQVLCWNCNLGKHLNHGVCPHKTVGEQVDKISPDNLASKDVITL